MNETAEKDSSYTWSSDVSLADANEIKNAYIEPERRSNYS